MINGKAFAHALRKFADPATEVKESTDGSGGLVSMVRDGLDHQYSFDQISGAIHARHDDGRRYQSLMALLASPKFADLDRLANTQRRILSSHATKSALPQSIAVDDNRISTEKLNGEINSVVGRTKVVLLDGPAGVGKTFLIEELVD